MAYQVITDFRQGLDARKFKLSLPPGTLTTLVNGHITQGGEIEKRKAFVPVTMPAIFSGIHFGLQPTSGGIYIFGSFVPPAAKTGSRSRTTNVASLFVTTSGTRGLQTGDVVNISGIGGVGYNGNGITLLSASAFSGAGTHSQTITYASVGGNEGVTADTNGRIILQQTTQLSAPLIYEVLPNPGLQDVGQSPDMTAVKSSTVFGDAPFAIASYSDGTVFPFYGLPQNVTMFGGTVTPGACPPLADSFTGLQLALYTTEDIFSGEFLLENLAKYINVNLSDSYTTNWVLGGSHFDLFSVPTTLDGTPFTVDVNKTTAAGTLTAAQQTNGTASVAATQAVGTFQIISAGAGTQATGTIINSNDNNAVDGDTVTIDSITYRFKNAMTQAYDVKIGGGHAATYASFAAAINGTGVSGTDYFAGTLKHPTVLCSGSNTGALHNSISLMAISGGTAGNALVTTSSNAARFAMSGATLSGAVASQITQIVINAATNLLAAPVAFTTDEQTTAAAVAAAINSNGASGYQATSSGSTLNIMPTAAGATPNGYTVQVQAQGTIVCGTGAFTLAGSGFTVDYCRANGVDLMNDASPYIPPNSSAAVLTYPIVPSQVLADFCRVVANSINSGTATHGYLAHSPQGGITIFISKATTTSSDKQTVLDVNVTASVGQTGAVSPGATSPVSVTLSADAVVIPAGGKSAGVTAQPAGGVAPYSFRWVPQSSTFVSSSASVVANNPKAAQTTFSCVNRTHSKTQPPLTSNQVQFACVVTDALGQQATSEVCNITVLAVGT